MTYRAWEIGGKPLYEGPSLYEACKAIVGNDHAQVSRLAQGAERRALVACWDGYAGAVVPSNQARPHERETINAVPRVYLPTCR